MKAQTFGFKVSVHADPQGWRDYTIYRWDHRHNTEIVMLSTIAHGSIKNIQAIARDHARLLESQHATA